MLTICDYRKQTFLSEETESLLWPKAIIFFISVRLFIAWGGNTSVIYQTMCSMTTAICVRAKILHNIIFLVWNWACLVLAIMVLGHTLHIPKTHKIVTMICDKLFSSLPCSILNLVSQKIDICIIFTYSRVHKLIDPLNCEKWLSKVWLHKSIL